MDSGAVVQLPDHVLRLIPLNEEIRVSFLRIVNGNCNLCCFARE